MDTDKLFAGRKYPLDLLIIIFLSIIGVICAIALPDGNALRIILGIPLLLLFPGYALVSLLWPENNKDGKGIGSLERIALSIGLSIAIIAILGLLLSYTFGLTLISIITSNLLVLFLLSIIAYYRRSLLPISNRYCLDLTNQYLPFSSASEKIIAVIIVGAIVISSGVVTYMLVNPSSNINYSEFYILDINGTTDNYPINISVNDTATVLIGIVSHENSLVNYTVVSGIGNNTEIEYINNWDNITIISNNTNTARNISLNQGSMFEESFTFRFTSPGTYRVVWNLLIEGQITDYRLHMWINVNP